jgi:putative NIF3 family GTP cyclohydrolase 1 type 2
MKAIDVRNHFVSQAPWVDPDKTVDKVIVGDPDKEIRRILVTWISSFEAVRKAVAGGFDMLMTHEPTFWVHANELSQPDPSPIGCQKRRFIEEAGLVVLRNHDVWDRFPQIGIPWAWAKFLGVTTQPVAIGHQGYQHRYDIAPVSLEALSRDMARRTATIGEPAVQVVGDLSRTVSKIGIGTGCACRIDVFQEMGCDVAVVCDDGSCYWKDIQRAADQDYSVIRVNHGTSEEPGMRTLTDYINRNLPGVTAKHLPHGSTFRLLGAVS